MKGISSSTKKRVYELVDDLFDKMSLSFLGNIPSLRNKKNILFTSRPDYTLAHLFLKGLGSNNPNPQEEEAMKNILSTAEEYVSSLRSKTKAQLVDKIDAYVREKRMKGFAPSSVDIKKYVDESLDSAKKHMRTIAEAETTKSRNMGRLFNIAKVGDSQGVSDPNVFFVVLRDNVTCKHCIQAHLLPDGVTPKVYKLSEVKFSYLGKDEKGKSVSVAGQHPHCRCSLSFLAPNFGFKNGQISYIGDGHDEYKKQRG